MKRSIRALQTNASDETDVVIPSKQRRIDHSQSEDIQYPIKMMVIGGPLTLNDDPKGNNKRSNSTVPELFSVLNPKQRGLIRNCGHLGSGKVKLMNIYHTNDEGHNLHLSMHWMNLSKLFSSDSGSKKHYKPLSTMQQLSSAIIYYMDIRDPAIAQVAATKFHPIKRGLNKRQRDQWRTFHHWTWNKLIFSSSICNLSSPKQLFIVFHGMKNEEIRKEILRRNASEKKKKKSDQNSLIITEEEITSLRDQWLEEAQKYLDVLLFQQIGWKKDRVHYVVPDESTKSDLSKMYREKILNQIQIPIAIRKMYDAPPWIRNGKIQRFDDGRNGNELCMLILEYFVQSKTRNMVLIGYIRRGTVHLNHQYTAYPLKQEFKVTSIRGANDESLDYAPMGLLVGICTDIEVSEKEAKSSQYTAPRVVTSVSNEAMLECDVDFKQCIIWGVFHWDDASDHLIEIGKQVMLECAAQRAAAQIIGIQLSYSTCTVLKAVHESIGWKEWSEERDEERKYRDDMLLSVERLIVSFLYRIKEEYFCDHKLIVAVTPSIEKIGICLKPLCDTKGIMMSSEAKCKPFNRVTILSNGNQEVIGKGKVQRLIM